MIFLSYLKGLLLALILTFVFLDLLLRSPVLPHHLLSRLTYQSSFLPQLGLILPQLDLILPPLGPILWVVCSLHFFANLFPSLH